MRCYKSRPGCDHYFLNEEWVQPVDTRKRFEWSPLRGRSYLSPSLKTDRIELGREKEKRIKAFSGWKNLGSINVKRKMHKLSWKMVNRLVWSVWFSAHFLSASHKLSSHKTLGVEVTKILCSSKLTGKSGAVSGRRRGILLRGFQMPVCSDFIPSVEAHFWCRFGIT